ncbi:MAG: DUF7662 domain-containing protein [Dehalococcoidia bacterium]
MPPKEKYAPLGSHLRPLAAEHSDVTLTFAEIERIIGTSLPRGAMNPPFWQGVNGKPPSRARAWISAGFVAQPDPVRSRVRFHRQTAAPARPSQSPVARPAAAHGASRSGDRR